MFSPIQSLTPFVNPIPFKPLSPELLPTTRAAHEVSPLLAQKLQELTKAWQPQNAMSGEVKRLSAEVLKLINQIDFPKDSDLKPRLQQLEMLLNHYQEIENQQDLSQIQRLFLIQQLGHEMQEVVDDELLRDLNKNQLLLIRWYFEKIFDRQRAHLLENQKENQKLSCRSLPAGLRLEEALAALQAVNLKNDGVKHSIQVLLDTAYEKRPIMS